MGLIQRLIKSALGFLLIMSLSAFAMTVGLYHVTSEDYAIEQFKTLAMSQEEFSSGIINMHSAMQAYFSVNDENQTSIKVQDKNLTFTRQDAELSAEEFQDLVLDKVMEGMYDASLRNVGYNTDLTLRDLNNNLYSWMRIAVIISIIIVLASLFLVSGRLVFLGVNFLIVGITYYPMRFLTERTLKLSLQQSEAAAMIPIITGIMGTIFSYSAKWYLYFFIAGIVCIALGILFKVLGIGLWFQSFFEKKKKI